MEKKIGKFALKSVEVIATNVIGYSIGIPVVTIIIPFKMVHDIYDEIYNEFQKTFKQQPTEQSNKTNENNEA